MMKNGDHFGGPCKKGFTLMSLRTLFQPRAISEGRMGSTGHNGMLVGLPCDSHCQAREVQGLTWMPTMGKAAPVVQTETCRSVTGSKIFCALAWGHCGKAFGSWGETASSPKAQNRANP